MEDLIHKYRDNKLTSAELLQLRELMDRALDDEIVSMLEKEWLENSDDTVDHPFTEAEVRDILRKIKAELQVRKPHYKYVNITKKILSRAAALLLPVFIATTCYFYYAHRNVMSEMVCVTTQEGEKANVVLPDGTKIKLNDKSELRYNVSDFSGKDRRVDFKGEAYFDVAKIEGKTFSVKGTSHSVKVLGTKFNLYSYDNDSNVVVALDEGKVLFAADGGNSVVLAPGEKAVLNRNSGNISVEAMNPEIPESAWMSNEIVLRHASLEEILSRISTTYRVKVNVNLKKYPQETFSGVFPTNNMNEAFDILEALYHVNVTVNGRVVTVSPQ